MTQTPQSTPTPTESHGGSCPACPMTRNWRFGLALVALLIGAYALTAWRTRAPAHPPSGWYEDYSAAVTAARADNKPMLLEFSATWCPSCSAIARNVLPDPRVNEALADFVPVKVDVDKNQELAAKYDINPIPVFIVLDRTGKEVYRFLGPPDVESFIKQIDEGRKLATG